MKGPFIYMVDNLNLNFSFTIQIITCYTFAFKNNFFFHLNYLLPFKLVVVIVFNSKIYFINYFDFSYNHSKIYISFTNEVISILNIPYIYFSCQCIFIDLFMFDNFKNYLYLFIVAW